MADGWYTYQWDKETTDGFFRYVFYVDTKEALNTLQLNVEHDEIRLANLVQSDLTCVERYTWFPIEDTLLLKKDIHHFENSGEIFTNANGNEGLFILHGEKAVRAYTAGVLSIEEDYYNGQLSLVRRYKKGGDLLQSFSFDDNNTLASAFRITTCNKTEVTIEEQFQNGKLHGKPAVKVLERDTQKPIFIFNYHAGVLTHEWSEEEIENNALPPNVKSWEELEAMRKTKREYPYP